MPKPPKPQVSSYIDRDLFERMEIQRQILLRKNSRMSVKRSGGGPVVTLMTNSSIPLSAETSAGSYFAGPIFTVRCPQEQIHYVNHLQQLEEAEKMVRRALELAQKS